LDVLYAAVVEATFLGSVVVELTVAVKLGLAASVCSNALADSASVGWALVVASGYPSSQSPSSDRHPVLTEVPGTAVESPDSHWRCGTNSQQTTPA
jgi:hypothetical protein